MSFGCVTNDQQAATWSWSFAVAQNNQSDTVFGMTISFGLEPTLQVPSVFWGLFCSFMTALRRNWFIDASLYRYAWYSQFITNKDQWRLLSVWTCDHVGLDSGNWWNYEVGAWNWHDICLKSVERNTCSASDIVFFFQLTLRAAVFFC
jgi:hypothetical protein